MSVNLKKFKQLLLEPQREVREYAHALVRLQEVFISTQGDLNALYGNDLAVSAYALGYGLTNTRKLEFLLKQVNLPWDKIDRVIDFGSGPGTLAWAIAPYTNKNTIFHLIDRAPKMLEQAEKLWPLMGQGRAAYYQKDIPSLTLEQKKTTLVTVGHSFVENISENFFTPFMDYGQLIILEPGTPFVFEKLLGLREKLHPSFKQIYPCLSHAACPLKGTDNWCHQVHFTTYDPELEQMLQIAKMDRRSMPFIAQVYVKEDNTNERMDTYRYLRFIRQNKHAYDLELCGLNDDGHNQVFEAELPFKILSKEEKKLFKRQSWGELLQFQLKDLKGSSSRVESIISPIIG